LHASGRRRRAVQCVSGDFNRDGFADLAVGVPYEDGGMVADAGAVNVLYGRSGGLSAAGNQLSSADERT
jgi:hypothetical protein